MYEYPKFVFFFQTQYFTQQQIDEYRQCFYLYCQDGFAESASQLRYVMRSLGYSPTVPETVKYFNDHNKKVDFASFLEILHADSEKGDPMVEIIAALRGIDPKNQGWITVPEFVSILSSVGERISREEIDNILLQLDLKSSSRVPYAKLIQSLSSTPMPYHQKKKWTIMRCQVAEYEELSLTEKYEVVKHFECFL